MKDTHIASVMKSHYCKAVFILAFFGAYFLVPEKVFYDGYAILGFAFMLSFAAVFTCLIRNLKEHIFASRVASASLLGAIATATGFSAFQMCTIGLSMCGASFGFGILSAILPGFFITFLMEYSVAIVVLSVLVQLFSLRRMGCFT